jgi:hypothetical protein
LEVIDVAKDPYLMQNHLGQYECRLCLTLHTNEGNYLAHTQGKRHQQNLAKRAAMEARDKPIQPAPKTAVAPRKTVKIGKPGYRVTKLYDADAQQRHLLFQASSLLSLHLPVLGLLHISWIPLQHCQNSDIVLQGSSCHGFQHKSLWMQRTILLTRIGPELATIFA